jgi:hypothetical protein
VRTAEGVVSFDRPIPGSFEAGKLHLEELRKKEPPLAVRLARLAWPIAVGLALSLNVAALLYAAIH